MEERKSILIVDDHPLFREGLKSIISRAENYEVVGEAGSALEGLALAEKRKPRMIIIDLSLPDKSGISLTREVKRKLPDILAIIVSMHSKIDYIAEAFQAGASGYVVKDSASDKLIAALKAVSRGEHYIDSSLSTEIAGKLLSYPVKETRVTDAKYNNLTAREQEIMQLLVEGNTARQIAEKLCISPKTVENHRANIMNKLEVHHAVELVRYGFKLGLVDLDLWKS